MLSCIFRILRSIIPLRSHLIIIIIIHFKFTIPISIKQCIPPRYVLDYSKADFLGLSDYRLENDPFQRSTTFSNPGELWSFRKTILLDQFVPRVKLRARRSVPWMTGAFRHRVNRLRSLKRRLKLKVSSIQTQTAIQSAEQEFQKHYSQAKSDYEQSLLLHDSHSFVNSKVFRYFRKLSKTDDIPHSMYNKSDSASSSNDKADLFNTYFHSVITRSLFTLPSSLNKVMSSNTLKNMRSSMACLPST